MAIANFNQEQGGLQELGFFTLELSSSSPSGSPRWFVRNIGILLVDDTSIARVSTPQTRVGYSVFNYDVQLRSRSIHIFRVLWAVYESGFGGTPRPDAQQSLHWYCNSAASHRWCNEIFGSFPGVKINSSLKIGWRKLKEKAYVRQKHTTPVMTSYVNPSIPKDKMVWYYLGGEF